ncbi:gastric triacylglycerol lipase isoform X1 [Cricetulus griseus]|uniref:gastric triacylglycerol lipase isoform X1 n=1 Tax=Cricetulus griseus TaxID=10029 RepID=UPI00022F5271|nr:gastric triacylglycerol lipase isoform X1 [Cricetulus griseus]
MWLLLTVTSVISAFGGAHGLNERLSPEILEAMMNINLMINFMGYPSEEYQVMTGDGYILGVFRIPHGKTHSENSGKRPVVFLQHGWLTSATNWMENLSNNSLPFILADAGYDVWLGNSRGNPWSRRNLYYSPNSVEFWAFSFDEMAKYDLPATIDFIVQKTGQEKLHYVGHSQGTTIGFIAFSTNPTLANRIKTFYALAPVATVTYAQSPLKKLSRIPGYLLKVCDLVARAGRLQAFNWGSPFQNQLHYNQSTPPDYDVSAMTVPIAVWNGGQDITADPRDVSMLLPKLQNLIYHKEVPRYKHLDFLRAMNAPQEVYNEIVSMMAKDQKN